VESTAKIGLINKLSQDKDLPYHYLHELIVSINLRDKSFLNQESNFKIDFSYL